MLPAALLLGAVALQASPAPPFDPGPAVGQPLPRFEARDQDGQLRTFEGLKGPNGLVVLFFRSADW